MIICPERPTQIGMLFNLIPYKKIKFHDYQPIKISRLVYYTIEYQCKYCKLERREDLVSSSSMQLRGFDMELLQKYFRYHGILDAENIDKFKRKTKYISLINRIF